MVLPLLGAIAGPALGLVGSMIGNASRERGQREEIENQKEFAQHGLRWKVADAKKAGLHPLAALGASTASYAPVGLGENDTAASFSAAGQDLSRSIDATRTLPEKLDAFTQTSQQLTLQRMGLENELLASQIAKTRQAGNPPAFPMASPAAGFLPGQGDALPPGGRITELPLERVTSMPGRPNIEPGAINDLGYSHTGSGFAPVMSEDVKDRIEEDLIGNLLWSVRNRIMPTLRFNSQPPDDVHTFYNPFTQQYERPKFGPGSN